MNIRWLWGNFIEPEWKLSRDQVRKVHRLVHERYVPRWKMLSFTGIVLLLTWTAFGLLQKPLSLWFVSLGTLRGWFVSAAILLVPLMIAGIWSYRMIYTRPIRRAMRDIGYDVCVNCGYWLRGLNDDVRRCPECGAERESMPKPHSTEPS